MPLNLGYHSGTIAWDTFELCSQTIPHLCSLFMYDCLPFRWKTLSTSYLCFLLPSISQAALCSLNPDPASYFPLFQSFPTRFPNRFTYMLRLFSEHSLHSCLKWEWDSPTIPPHHHSPEDTAVPEIFSSPGCSFCQGTKGQHSPCPSWPLLKSLCLHPHIKIHLLCFSCHLAISLKSTNCISFDTAISLYTKIWVWSEKIYVRTLVMALLAKIKKNNRNWKQFKYPSTGIWQKIVEQLHGGPLHPS